MSLSLLEMAAASPSSTTANTTFTQLPCTESHNLLRFISLRLPMLFNRMEWMATKQQTREEKIKLKNTIRLNSNFSYTPFPFCFFFFCFCFCSEFQPIDVGYIDSILFVDTVVQLAFHLLSVTVHFRILGESNPFCPQFFVQFDSLFHFISINWRNACSFVDALP